MGLAECGVARGERILGIGALGVVVHLITFNCYGAHLRGEEIGSVDRVRVGRGGAIEASVGLVEHERRVMTHAEAKLDLRVVCGAWRDSGDLHVSPMAAAGGACSEYACASGDR